MLPLDRLTGQDVDFLPGFETFDGSEARASAANLA